MDHCEKAESYWYLFSIDGFSGFLFKKRKNLLYLDKFPLFLFPFIHVAIESWISHDWSHHGYILTEGSIEMMLTNDSREIAVKSSRNCALYLLVTLCLGPVLGCASTEISGQWHQPHRFHPLHPAGVPEAPGSVSLSVLSFFGTRLASPTSIPDRVLSARGDMFSGITDFPFIFTSPSQWSNEKSMGHSFRQLSPARLDTWSVLSSVF